MNLRHFIPRLENIKDKSYKYTFTVFTPVYNAEKTIERVHLSLLNQTFNDFEWIIINDGSTDDSHNVISNFLNSSPLKIKYVNNKKNRHKMACFLQAVDLANGSLFLTFDADDECLSEALDIFNSEYYALNQEERLKIIAVTGLCIDQNSNAVGDNFPTSPLISDPFEVSAIKKIKGEKWGFTSTKHLQSIIYNDCFIKNGHMYPGVIWNLFAKHGYKTKYINEVVRVYHTNIENSITSSAPEKKALGSVVYHITLFNWFFNLYVLKVPLYFSKNLYFLLSRSKYLNVTLKNYTNSIDSYLLKFIFILLWPTRKFLN